MDMNRHTPIVVDASHLTAEHGKAVLGWVRSLGVDTGDLAARFAIVRGEGEWELHVSRKVRGPSGDLRFDYARQDFVTEPQVVGLGTLNQVWPDFGTEGLVQ